MEIRLSLPPDAIAFKKIIYPNGSVESTISKSLENRLIILPLGVVSKKDMGARMIAARRFLCKEREAPTVAKARVKDRLHTKITETESKLH